MKTLSIKTINSTNIESFYAAGKAIRESHNPAFARLFRDSTNLHHIMANPHIKSRFFVQEGIGRIGAYYSPGSETGFLGWYECIDDFQLAKEMLQVASDWLKDQGCTKVIGPMNGSTWYSYRFNLSSEVPLLLTEPFQPKCYVEHWKSFGFEPSTKYISTYTRLPDLAFLDEQQVAKKLSEVGLELKQLNKAILEEYHDAIYDFLVECFAGNLHFSDVSKEEYDEFSAGFPMILDEVHSYIALDQSGKPISFFSCVLDLYKEVEVGGIPKLDSKIILKTIATHPNWQNKQIGTLIMNTIYHKAKANGIEYVVHALMQADNVSAVAGKRKFPTETLVEYALFSKAL